MSATSTALGLSAAGRRLGGDTPERCQGDVWGRTAWSSGAGGGVGAAGVQRGWGKMGRGQGRPKTSEAAGECGAGVPNSGNLLEMGPELSPSPPQTHPPRAQHSAGFQLRSPRPPLRHRGGGVSQSFWERTGTYPEPFPGETHRDRRAPSPGRFGSVRSGPVRSGPSAPAPTRRRGGAAAGALSAAVARRAAAGSGGGNMRQSLTQQRPGGVPLPDSVGKCRGWG